MRLRSMFTLLVTTGTLAACALNSPMPRAPVTSRTPTPESKPAAPVTVGANQYLVQKGDTLYNIGRKFGIPVQKLAEFNQLQAPYGIHVGQVLNISAKTSNTGNNKSNETASTSDDAEVVTSAISRPGQGGSEDAASTAGNTPATPATTVAPKPANGQQNIEGVADTDIQWQWPLTGKISTGFDPQTNKGLNIAGNPGQTINAAGAGKVIYSGMDVRGYGKLIIIKHNNNLLSVYAHQGNSVVKEGAFVTQGEKLAVLPATTSDGKSPSLHFEIRQKGKPVDPVGYLPNSAGAETSGNS